MSTIRSVSIWMVLPILLAAASMSWADPMGTTFTYQGQLRSSGVPCSGPYDIMFRLFDSATSPTTIGGVTAGSVPVVNGLFTVNLDMGGTFTGEARWVEIRVQPTGTSGWTILSPRQQLMPVPYAICAASVVSGSITNTSLATDADSLNKVSGGRMYSVPAIPFIGINRNDQVTANEYFGVLAPTTAWGGMFMKTSGSSGLPFYGYATGGGANMAYHWMDGATGDWSLYNNGTHLIVKADGKVGIGTTSPVGPLDVRGVYTGSENSGGILTAVNAANDSAHHVAVYGASNAQENYGIGVKGTGGYTGVLGTAVGSGTGYYYGMQSNARAPVGSSCVGVLGSASGDGVNYGVYGTAYWGTVNYAGYFAGNVYVGGTLTKSGGSFKIDHPLDPANKYLSHSFVESPDMKNIYDGVVTTDAKGYATVTLPDWFSALNKDFRYQLTCIGQFAQAIVARKIQGNQFVIQTDKPDVEVSWQVTGIRQDAWANANRIPVEEAKPQAEQGRYLTPEVFGKPRTLSVAKAPEAADAR